MTRTITAAAFATVLLSSTALADVQTRTIAFESKGATLTGTLYLPEDHNGSALPTVIVTGAWTSVEEQMPKTYAEAMVERGFAALTFDFRGWGKSDDLPDGERFKEDPLAKTEDIRAAFSFAATLPEVDRGRIHGLGVCASAGYMVDAAAGNPLVSHVGLVAPWLQNREIVEEVYGGAEGVDALIGVSRSADQAGGAIIPAAGPEGAEGVLMPIGGYYYDPSRGAIPAYDNKWNQTSWEGWLTYLPADNPQRLDKPLAVVHSEAAAIPQGVKAFLAGYAGAVTAQWLDNVTQFDFYDSPEDVDRAADTVARHFKGGSAH
ncbi:MAG: alpha/beta hydrolase [Pseudomonadota bacterium]